MHLRVALPVHILMTVQQRQIVREMQLSEDRAEFHPAQTMYIPSRVSKSAVSKRILGPFTVAVVWLQEKKGGGGISYRVLTFDPSTPACPSRRAEKRPAHPPYFDRASAPGKIPRGRGNWWNPCSLRRGS